MITEPGEHDIGDGTRVVWVVDRDGNYLGLIERHGCRDGLAGGLVPVEPTFQPGSPHWTVEAGSLGAIDGLTLSLSILCRACGHHGWIRDGRWIPA